VASIVESVKTEWRRFGSDSPGHRFVRRYERLQSHRSPGKVAVRVGLGILLVTGGVFLWFFPGPGWLLVLFGLAMFAGHWRALATTLDGLEVRLRRWVRAAHRSWTHASAFTKTLVVVVGSALVAGIGYALWVVFLAK
jgi:hypothetical protein